MTLQLSSRDIDRIRALSRVMLSPLGPGDKREWLDRLNEGLIELTGADRALSALPMRDPCSVVVRNMDPGVVPAFLDGRAEDDPALAKVMAERLPVVHQSMVYGEDLERLPLFEEFLRPWGIVNSVAFNAFLPGGGLAIVGVMKGDLIDPEFQRRGHGLLQLLQSSFEAGVEALVRVGHRGPALARMLDALEEPAALYDASGGLVHANRRLVAALGSDREAGVVWSGLAGLAGALLGGGEGGALVPAASLRIGTERQRYRLSGTVVGEGVLEREPGVLIRVALLDRARARADELVAGHGLTEREAEVALHLGDGETDREIAEALGISWHTVRTHVERVLGKLGVDSRTKVARIVATGGHPGASEGGGPGPEAAGPAGDAWT